MSRITSFRCDRCGDLIADHQRSIVTLTSPKDKWATDLCAGCTGHIKNQADFQLKNKTGRKVKPPPPPVGAKP